MTDFVIADIIVCALTSPGCPNLIRELHANDGYNTQHLVQENTRYISQSLFIHDTVHVSTRKEKPTQT